MKRPKFLYFDLGRVLLEFDHEYAVIQLAELTNQTRDRIRDLVFETTLQADYEKGHLDTGEFCQQIRHATASTASDDQICMAASDIFGINRGVDSLVRSLHRDRWPMGILSNTCDAHWRHIRAQAAELIALFSDYVLSFEVRASKPDAAIYQHAASLVDRRPEELFFVDDRPENVEGALRAGWDAVLYTSPEQLASDLKKRGVMAIDPATNPK